MGLSPSLGLMDGAPIRWDSVQLWVTLAVCRRMEHPGNGTQSEGTHFSFSGRLVLWASSFGNPAQYGLQEVPRESAPKRHASHHGADGARVASQLHDSVLALQLRWHARPWA